LLTRDGFANGECGRSGRGNKYGEGPMRSRRPTLGEALKRVFRETTINVAFVLLATVLVGAMLYFVCLPIMRGMLTDLTKQSQETIQRLNTKPSTAHNQTK